MALSREEFLEKDRIRYKKYYRKNRDKISKKRKEQYKYKPRTREEKDSRNIYNKEYNKTESFKNLQLKCHLKRLYGLKMEDYQDMLKKQKEKCAICGGKNKTKRLHVDHCHKTNIVRGLLCTKCNMGLGLFLDSDKLLSKAVIYIKSFQ